MMSEHVSAIGVFGQFAEDYLNFERTPQKSVFWLDTMKFLCRRLGNPQLSCPSVHVAGSKGKGSVAKMISCILEEAGFCTGLYTSPHLLSLDERIGTASGPFSEEVYEASVKELMQSVRSIKPDELPGARPVTWFELVTLLGMLCFKNAGTEYSVYEVGLGGRLDATNVIQPACCCITRIELEHTEFLGDTEEKIAAEKGGIIKPGVPVIISRQTEPVKDVLLKIAKERGAPAVCTDSMLNISEVVYKNRLLTSNDSYQLQKNRQFSCVNSPFQMDFSLSSKAFSRPLNISLAMAGEFQAENAATASLAAKTALPGLDEAVIERALAKAVLPGRFEAADLSGTQFSTIPALILDGAHTVQSVKGTVDAFCRLFLHEPEASFHGARLLFACAADKDAERIAPLFKGVFLQAVLTRPGEFKPSDFSRLKKAFDSAGIEHIACADCIKAVSYTLEQAAERQETVLVTGSFYLVAEVKKFLMASRSHSFSR